MAYRIVEDARGRAVSYRDGEPMSIAFEYLDEKAYSMAKAWLDDREVSHIDLGFREHHFQLIATVCSRKEGDAVFKALTDIDPEREVCINARWVEVS